MSSYAALVNEASGSRIALHYERKAHKNTRRVYRKIFKNLKQQLDDKQVVIEELIERNVEFLSAFRKCPAFQETTEEETTQTEDEPTNGEYTDENDKDYTDEDDEDYTGEDDDDEEDEDEEETEEETEPTEPTNNDWRYKKPVGYKAARQWW